MSQYDKNDIPDLTESFIFYSEEFHSEIAPSHLSHFLISAYSLEKKLLIKRLSSMANIVSYTLAFKEA